MASEHPRRYNTQNLARWPQGVHPGIAAKQARGWQSQRQCRAIAATTGQRCRVDAMRGATFCQGHGGREQLRAAKKVSPARWAAMARRAARRRAHGRAKRAPPDLIATQAWQSVARLSDSVRDGARVRLVEAWNALQAGNVHAWQTLLQDLRHLI